MFNCIEGYVHQEIVGWNVCVDSALDQGVFQQLASDLQTFKGFVPEAAEFLSGVVPIWVNASDE
jgi:hypothetical protein